MKKEVSRLLVMLFFILVVSGCGSTSSGSSGSNEQNYHTGTEGVTMSFISNAPPSKVYEGDKIEIVVELENKGAYPDTNVFQGKLFITGFDTNAFTGSWDGGDTMPSSLQGKSIYMPEGGFATKSYKVSSGVRVPFETDKYSPTIMVTNCYQYQTIATPIVCIDPDPYKIVSEDKVCSVESSISVGSGQGGPISVSKVEQQIGSDNVYFKIFIKNSGSGQVVKKSEYSNCPFKLEIEDLDKVEVSAKLPYDSSPQCTPAGSSSDPVRLVNGQGFIFCTFNKNSNAKSAYTTPLQIDLKYVYSENIRTKVDIIKVN